MEPIESPRDLWWNDDFLALMARRWRLEGVLGALDVGCGTGCWTRAILSMLPPDAHVVGVDPDASALELAERQARRLGYSDRVRFVNGTAERLPFEDATFDLVSCQTVLIHVGDAETALTEMIRVTKPGGLVAVAEPNNFAGSMVESAADPRPSLEEVLCLAELQYRIEAGKAALGQGDDSIGERLPGLFRQVGLRGVRVFNSDRCATLLPPYASLAQQFEIHQIRSWSNRGMHSSAGAEARTRACFMAGGGSAERFDAIWPVAEERARRVLASIEAGVYSAARGYVFYLVSGRVPRR